MISYFLSLLVSFIGLFVGTFIAVHTREELDTGKRYFPILQKVILASIIAILLLQNAGLNIIIVVAISIIAFIMLKWIKIADIIVYPVLGLVFFFSRANPIITFLIFAFGMLCGSLITANNKRWKFLKISSYATKRYCIFLILAALLWILNFLANS